MPEAKGWRNTYTCPTCGESIVTVNVDEGTTPMLMACKATRGCKGTSESQWGRVADDAVVTHEWYLPTLKWARRKGEEWLAHVRQGGLALREAKP